MLINSSLRGICFLIILFVFSSCAEDKYIGSLVDYPGEKDGLIKAYFESGALYEEGQFKQGQLDGFRKIYYQSGNLQVQETYQLGTFQGPYVKYYENGNKKVEGNYIKGSMEGIWKTYYEDGALKDEVAMKENLENGPFKEYHKNGKTKAIGEYLNGEFEHGLLQLFDEFQTLIKKMECDKGICRTIWTLEGKE